jgi:hypothetical protein
MKSEFQDVVQWHPYPNFGLYMTMHLSICGEYLFTNLVWKDDFHWHEVIL